MKRLLLLAVLVLGLEANAFTLVIGGLIHQPQLVWYEAQATASGAVVEGANFIPPFLPYGLFGLDGGGTFFGLDSFEFDTITCEWAAAGTASGGTDTMRVQLIQRSDAGVLCTCDLPGACTDAAGTEHTCGCGGVKYLTGQQALGQGYVVQWHSATNCAANANPQGVRCAIPFHQ